MSKIIAAAFAATALVGAGVLTQSVTTSASTAVGTVEATAPASLGGPDAPGALDLARKGPVAALVVDPGPTAGGTATYTVTGSVAHAVNSSGTVVVDGFDGRGTLLSASVTTEVGGQTVGSYENRGVNTYNFYIDSSSRFAGEITGPGITGAAYSGTFNLYEGAVASGMTVSFDAEVTAATNTEDATDLAPYLAPTVTFSTLTSGDFVNNANSDGTLIVDSFFHASVSVTYTYSTPASIGVVKTVTADAGVLLPTFNFAVTCSDGFAAEVAIEGAGATLVSGMSAKSTCTVTESAPSGGTWVAATGDDCRGSIVGVKPGETATINNRAWAGAYDPCTPL
ncbi:MAG: hypothetical protein R2706_18955 [Acidimicrobiales bacterium]